MPPASAPIVYTPSVERGSREFGHALVVFPYQNFINELVQSAVDAGISRRAARAYIEQIRGTLDHTASVLIGIGHLPNVNIFDPSDTDSAISDATNQQGDDSQIGSNGNANGHTIEHENSHINTANDHHATNSNSDERSWPNRSSSPSTTNHLPPVLQQQNGAQNFAHVNGHSAHAALPAQNHGNASTEHGLSATLGAYDPSPIRQSDMTLDPLHIGRASAHGAINSNVGGVDSGRTRLSPTSTANATVGWNAARLPLDFGR